MINTQTIRTIVVCKRVRSFLVWSAKGQAARHSLRPPTLLSGYGLFLFMLLTFFATPGIGISANLANTTEIAEYNVTFEATWSENSHPLDIPPNPHFSGLIGATHNENVVFWEPGGLASPGIEDMAELGSRVKLTAEVEAAIADGTSLSVLRGGGTPSPGSANFSFKIHQAYPLVTLVSMVAPSPDWFVGVHGLNLHRNGQWVKEMVVELLPYDAGTDSGVTFRSSDRDTNPPEQISLIAKLPFLVDGTGPPLGTFTFKRIMPPNPDKVTVSSRINSGSDDVEEQPSGTMYLNSSDLELVDDGLTNQTLGMIFRGIDVEQGAIITKAYIQFTTDEVSTDICNLTIHGEDTDNPLDFTKNLNNLSGRAKTVASVNWNPDNWNNVGESSVGQKTPDIKAVIQEIINRDGWNMDNSINIIITGSGRRTAESYESGANTAPELVIEYIPASDVNRVRCRINSGSDDVEEQPSGTMYLNSSDLELVDDGLTNQTLGMIFRGIDVEQGAEITKAYIQFTTDEVSTDICNLTIHGEDTDNPLDFTKNLNNLSGRAKTVASVNWNPDNWNNVGESSVGQKTPDIKAVIQEIINRDGWNMDNSINIIITGSGRRTAESYESGANTAPELVIEYIPASDINRVRSKINSGSDDVEEQPSGTMYLNSSDLELVDDGLTNQTLGMIFRGIDLEQGAEITKAYIQFTTDEVSTDICNLTIHGEDTDNPLDFTKNLNNLSGRAKTVASVNWNPGNWNNVGESSVDQKTPDIKAVIQEIVNRDGWDAGSSINVIITGSGRRTAESYESGANTAPVLVIEYAKGI